MLIWLINNFNRNYINFNTFSYLAIRSIISLLTSLFISLLIGKYVITFLKKHSYNQIIRNEGPKSHFSKSGTPTMGGIIILISITISILLWSCLSNPYVWYILIILLGYGVIGAADDHYKIYRKNTSGMIAVWKYFWMSIIALGISLILYNIDKSSSNAVLIVPFFKYLTILQLGYFYFLLSYFVIVGSGNAVNLTDGLDGLAIVPIIFIAVGLSFISWITGNKNLANYLHIPYLYRATELVIVCSTIIGSGLGFLWFNTYPAKIFMGDTGSLSLGGTLGIITVLLHQEFLFLIMSGVFVYETLSVIIQVIYFKISKKRIFLMSPIHHHYELMGYPEPCIVVRFWIISLVMLLIGLSMLIKTY